MIGAVGLGITSAVSIGFNIYQGIQNTKLRKQIEQLKAIIRNQQDEIKELQKQMDALKLWAFKQKLECSKKIKYLEQNLVDNRQRLSRLENQVA